jgi:hypothetical protein
MSLSLEHAKEARIMKFKKKNRTYLHEQQAICGSHVIVPGARKRRAKTCANNEKKRRRRGGEAAAQETKEQSVGFLQRPPASSPFLYIRIKYIHLYIFIHNYVFTYPYSNV